MENSTRIIKQYIEEELQGRYWTYISDKMLEVLLSELINKKYREELYLYPDRKPEMTSVVYLSTVFVFETILENGCNAKGNGHHVAQDLASRFTK